jgi:hypothetical protein
MKATFLISQTDYVNAMRLFAKPSTTFKVYYLIAAIIVMLLIILKIPTWILPPVIGGFIGATGMIILQRTTLVPLIARRHYKKYKLIHDEQAIELLDDGVRYSSVNGEGRQTWDKILKWRQNEKYILIYIAPNLFHIVPKSLQSSGFEIPLLIERLSQHVGAAI